MWKINRKIVTCLRPRWDGSFCFASSLDQKRQGEVVSFSQSSKQTCLSHATFCAHTKIERHKTKDEISKAQCLISLKGVWGAKLKSQNNLEGTSGGQCCPTHTHSSELVTFYLCQKKFNKHVLNTPLLWFLHILKIMYLA